MQSNPTMTITKYQFSGLLKQAWGKTMSPSTISAGFHKCGVFPFNPDAIDCGLSVTNPGNTTTPNLTDASNGKQHTSTSEKANGSQWPAERVALYERRYEEGYDLPDEEYSRWLRETHPEVDSTINNVSSLAEYFSDLPVATPVEVAPMQQESEELPEQGSEEEVVADQGTHEEGVRIGVEVVGADQPQSPSESDKTQKNTSKDAPSNSDTNSSGRELQYISKYLIQYVPTKPAKKDETVRISGARVLTGDKCAVLLKEREEKKRKEKEEKEKRKLLREQKKRDKEEEMKKKKAAIAEKKAAAAEKKAATAAKKAASILRNGTGRSLAGTKHGQTSSSTRQAKQARSSVAMVDPDAPSSSTSAADTVWQCPFCFECYETEDGEDWVKCGCGRWTHESCITDVIVDCTGKELFCPFCAV